MENQQTKPTQDEKEIDLGALFNILIEIAHRIASGFRRFLRGLLSVLIWFLLFIRRRILLLAVALLLSLIPGLYIFLIKGPEFYSVMTVKVNFQGAHNLYNKIDYFNALMQMHENKKLAELFRISEVDADKLVRFEIDPIDDDIQAAELYKQYFFNPEDYTPVAKEGQILVTRDSAWSSLIRFKEFKNNLKVYDFPLQKIKLVSKSPSGYSAIQAGFISAVSANSALQRKKQIFDSVNQEETKVVRNSLSNADSLMKAFNKQITSGPAKTENAASLTLSAKSAGNPEIEIFDETMKLKNELSRLQRQGANTLDVLDVYADFNEKGTYTSPFKESFLTYAKWCVLVALALLLMLEAYIAVDTQIKLQRNA
jgi:hypothetical protein